MQAVLLSMTTFSSRLWSRWQQKKVNVCKPLSMCGCGGGGCVWLELQKHPVVSAAHEPVRISPIKPSICLIDPDTAVGSCWGEWRRKANTGHRSMDLQWLLVCLNTHTHTPPQTSTRCKPLSVSRLCLIRPDVIPAEYIKENLFILSDPLACIWNTKAGGDGGNGAGREDSPV